MPHSDAGPESSGPRIRRHRLPRTAIVGAAAISAGKALQYRAEFAAFRAAEKIARLLGLERSASLSAFVWRSIGPWSGRHRRAIAQLEQALPESSLDERRRIMAGVWDNLGRTFAEAFHLDTLYADAERVQTDEESWELARRGPAVFATMHTANWEVAAIAATRADCRLAGVYQRVKNPGVDAQIVALRSPFYGGGLHVKGSNLVPTLISLSRQGRSIGIVSDQRDARGITTPFFGMPAPSTPFPAYLAHKLNIPLLAARVVRLQGSRFEVEVSEIAVPRTGKRMQDIEAATIALQSKFESWIRERPEQWMWLHRRWE